MKKKIIILGATGSIGTQALDIIRHQSEYFEVVGLSANKNEEALSSLAEEFGVKNTALSKGESVPLIELVESVEADLVLVAVAGTAGLFPTLAAIRSGKDIALANKETLVMAGEWVMNEVKRNGVKMIPVDSEHSAIFQCLNGIKREDISKIILTCSGGPFLGKTKNDLTNVTAQDALKHPTWSMGAKISIDSATLVNKGFEVIEAHHLFGLDYDQIEVRVHPQSIVHGMVELKDGNTLMQASNPDMRIPINHALHYPNRVLLNHEALTLSPTTFIDQKLEFLLPDDETFEGLKLAYEVGRRGGMAPAIFNVVNDQAVHEFLKGEISFLEIYEKIKVAIEDERLAPLALNEENLKSIMTSLKGHLKTL
jgi:1-deoxy-D-xylulose-5-phosphate reductoisomerase